MTDTTTPAHEWTETGRAFIQKAADRGGRISRTFDQLQAEVEVEVDALTWHDVPEDGVLSGPMSPVLLIKEVIQQLELRRIVAFAYGGCMEFPDGPESATYSLVGVEVRTKRQRFRLVLLDTGVGAVPVCADWYEGRAE